MKGGLGNSYRRSGQGKAVSGVVPGTHSMFLLHCIMPECLSYVDAMLNPFLHHSYC